MQDISLERASRWITPSYRKNPEQMDALMSWAEKSGCIDAETGEVFELNRSIAAAKEPLIKVSRTKPARRIDNPENN
jgi:hypothetical protein